MAGSFERLWECDCMLPESGKLVSGALNEARPIEKVCLLVSLERHNNVSNHCPLLKF